MIETEQKVIYKAFGLSVQSEIALPELPIISKNEDSSDIEIVIDDLSKLWMDLSDQENAFVIKENFVMFHVPDIATFSIQKGNRISVSPLKEGEEDVIRLYILGTCMGAILMQRKILPLHGSAVEINGKAYAFMGNSGAGKSTTASVFLNKGFKLLTDDVIAVSLSQEGDVPHVIPSYPQQKLWQDSINKLGMEGNTYRPIYGREDKYCIPVSLNYLKDPIPLAGVFEIVKTEEEQIKISKIDNLERFYTLYFNTYQNCFIPDLGLMDWHFNITAKIINKIDIYRLKRPITGVNPIQVYSQIMNILKEGE